MIARLETENEDRDGALATAAQMAALVALGFAAIMIETAPMRGVVKPDLLFCVVAAWALSRPAATPFALVLGLGLLRDLLTDGPVGAGALGLLLAAATLRANAAPLTQRGLAACCAAGLAAVALAVLAPCALLTVSLAPTPDALEIAARLLGTAALFPLLHLALRRRPRLARGNRENLS